MTENNGGDMALDYQARRAVAAELASRYRLATKTEKKGILNRLVELTEFNRRYAAALLRGLSKKIFVNISGQSITVAAAPLAPRRKRHSKYRPIIPLLPRLWYYANYISARRFHSFLQSFVPGMVKRHELSISKKQMQLLLAISPASLDRHLQAARRKITSRGLSHTRPSQLISTIPIATHRDRCRTEPGHLEIDLVGHEGGIMGGDHCYTLTCTDPFLGWTMVHALLNKAQVWTVLAMEAILAAYPLPVRHIYSDSGSEFINAHFKNFCGNRNIAFLRSRPDHKNDNCYVEQRNYSVVRVLVGYSRYEGEAGRQQLQCLYDLANPYLCFFQPSARLIRVERHGSKRTRKHDKPATPYERMQWYGLSDDWQKKLAEKFTMLSPVRLRDQMSVEQKRLLRMAKKFAIEKVS